MQNNGFDNSSVPNGESIIDQMMNSDASVLIQENQVNSGYAVPNEAAPQEQQPNQGIDIDPKFAHLNPQEAMFRTFQSRYDQMKSEMDKIKPDYERAKAIEETFIQLLEDDETLEAFLHERKPELIQRPDFKTYVDRKMKEEFGEDFVFDGNKATYDPLHIAYQERVRELYQEYQKGNVAKAKSIKELREKRQKEIENQNNQLRQSFQNLQQQHKLSNEQMRGFTNFIQKANTDINLLFNLWRLSTRQQQIPTVNGSFQSPNTSSNIDSVLKSYGF